MRHLLKKLLGLTKADGALSIRPVGAWSTPSKLGCGSATLHNWNFGNQSWLTVPPWQRSTSFLSRNIKHWSKYFFCLFDKIWEYHSWYRKSLRTKSIWGGERQCLVVNRKRGTKCPKSSGTLQLTFTPNVPWDSRILRSTHLQSSEVSDIRKSSLLSLSPKLMFSLNWGQWLCSTFEQNCLFNRKYSD